MHSQLHFRVTFQVLFQLMSVYFSNLDLEVVHITSVE